MNSKEILDLNDILESFINPKEDKSFIKKIFHKDIKEDLLERQAKMRMVKDGLNTSFWKEVMSPSIKSSLKNSLAMLLRPDSLSKSESELKAIIANMQSNLGQIADLKYLIEDGEQAQDKIIAMERKGR